MWGVAAGLASLLFQDLLIALTTTPPAIAMIALGPSLKNPLHVVAVAVAVAIVFTLYVDVSVNLAPIFKTLGMQVGMIVLRTIAAIIWGFVGWSTGAAWRRRQRNKAAAAKG